MIKFQAMNRYKIIGILLAWLAVALLHAAILRYYTDLEISVLAVHCFVRATVFFGITLLIYFIFSYGNFSALPVLQRVVNYSFLAVLSVGIWILAGWALDYMLLGKVQAQALGRLSVVYIPVGLMFFGIVVQSILIQLLQFKNGNDGFEEEVAEEPVKTEETPEILERIAVKSNTKIHVLPVGDLFFISSNGDYVFLHTENAKYLKEQTMKHFEKHLPNNFIRIHRSAIVNSDKISRVELFEKQSYNLVLKNNQRLKMSVHGYKLLRERMGL